MAPRFTRRAIDSWVPTLARLLGLALVPYIAVVDQGQNPGLIPLAVGLILLKTVTGNGQS